MTNKIPEQLKEAKEAFKAEIRKIHAENHTISDFDEFAKVARLALGKSCALLERKKPKFVFKLGDVKVSEDPDVKKKFLHGSAYVGPRKEDESSFFVRLDFTLANEPAQ